MHQNLTQLRVDGLTALQLAELQAAVDSVGDGFIRISENAKPAAGRVHEPGVITVLITLAPPVIAAVALWLSKQKKSRTREIRYSKVDPKTGAVETFELVESSYSEGESQRGAIEKLLETKLGLDTTSAS